MLQVSTSLSTAQQHCHTLIIRHTYWHTTTHAHPHKQWTLAMGLRQRVCKLGLLNVHKSVPALISK